MGVIRSAKEPNGTFYETHRNWDVEWNCWRQVVVRCDPDGAMTVLSDELVIDHAYQATKGPSYHASQEMEQLAAQARRDDRRADRKAKAEYYAELEDGGTF